VGTFLNYSSGLPIQVPAAQNALTSLLRGATVNSTRIPGVPLFTQDLNCHCFDPAKEFVLNKNAWQDPPSGVFGTAAPFYNDYRYQRTPQENVALSRTFAVKKGPGAFASGTMSLIGCECRSQLDKCPCDLNLCKRLRWTNTSTTLAGFGHQYGDCGDWAAGAQALVSAF
jgi:hypothetical protein